MGRARHVCWGSVSRAQHVTDSHTNMETIKQELLSVIINMLEFDRRGFIFIPKAHTYTLLMTGIKEEMGFV